MSVRQVLIGGSLLVHGGFIAALGVIREPKIIETTTIEMTESAPPAPPVPAEIEPAPPVKEEAPRPLPKAKAAPVPAAAPPPPVAEAAPSSLGALPDLGLELSGSAGGTGMALPASGDPATRPRAAAPVQKTLKAAPPPRVADTCDEGPAKPKLLNLPQPVYTEAARAAGLEGKVRVQITVDETGKVVAVQTLSTLGQGLDEAALTAARAATFEPAVRCGKPSRSTFTISIRFSAT